MSKSSRSRPSESVFGALGPDDLYFGNRVQAAARDAQQRWPLLGGLAPSAAEETPELTEGDKARWQPQPPLVPSKPAISRPSLSKKLEYGLSRLTQQTGAESKPAKTRSREALPGDDASHAAPAHASRAVRAAPTLPGPLARDEAPAASRPASRSEAPAPSTRAQAPAAKLQDDKSLGGLFRRLQNQAAPAAPTSTDGPRKSILGRLGKR